MRSYEINDLLQKQNNVVDIQTYIKIADSPQMIYGVVLNEAHDEYEFRTNDGYAFRFRVVPNM